MDLVQKYKTVEIITKHGKRSDYPDDLKTFACEREVSNIYDANIVVMEFSHEPDVYHVIKHRYPSMGEIVTRDTLNKMIEYNDKAINKEEINIAYGETITFPRAFDKYRVCPACDGLGINDTLLRTHQALCPRCYGTGKL